MDKVVSQIAQMTNKSTNKNNISDFAGQLMQLLSESEFQTHVWHLQTTAYSQHMALGGYYDEINGLKDSLIETYQGLHGVRISGNMDIKIDSTWTADKVIQYFKNLRTKLDGMYTNQYLSPGSLKNIMDEIIALVGKTEYLLTLKG